MYPKPWTKAGTTDFDATFFRGSQHPGVMLHAQHAEQLNDPSRVLARKSLDLGSGGAQLSKPTKAGAADFIARSRSLAQPPPEHYVDGVATDVPPGGLRTKK